MQSVDLCLGTAQFGLAYGVTNQSGQIPKVEARSLLELASQRGVRWLDTAQAYGDAEAILGFSLPTHHDFRLISKMPAQSSEAFNASSTLAWETGFQESLCRLGCRNLDGFLLHKSSDLSRPDADRLLSWLQSLQERGLVRRIGVSIYSASELDGLPLEKLQLVQLPLSLYDQRALQDRTISVLRKAGIAIHARSLYLQGLLLTPSPQWPHWIDPAFRQHHAALEHWAVQHNTSLLALALSFAQCCSDLEAAVVGVTKKSELLALLDQWSVPGDNWSIGDMERWSWPEGNSLDPRCWPS